MATYGSLAQPLASDSHTPAVQAGPKQVATPFFESARLRGPGVAATNLRDARCGATRPSLATEQPELSSIPRSAPELKIPSNSFFLDLKALRLVDSGLRRRTKLNGCGSGNM
jgi:hypothetical protein